MTCRPPALCFALLIGLTFIGCDTLDSDDFDDEEVAGTYGASTFVVASADTLYDVLDAGGTLQMTLEEDETVTGGQLVVPCTLPLQVPGTCEPGESGDVFQTMFDGTYAVSGNVVAFNHDAETFVRSVQWVFQADTLYAEFAASDTTAVGVALARQ